MIDIDYFKRINDTHGHRAGDHALQGLARVLQESCRASDIVGRYGGEEFCVLLPETNEEHAVGWAERVRRSIANKTGFIEDINLNITASFGVAQRLADTRTPDELIDLADQALLVAKRSGRDRVVGFQSVNRNTQIQPIPSGPTVVFQNKTAGDVMATIVTGLKVDDTVGSATRYFLRFRSDSAPVVDQDGKLVGILSERDVMSIMLLPNWWSMTIKDVMRCNVVCYGEDTPVLMIYEFLCRVLIRGVFVVRDGRPVGMISRASLLRWLTNSLALNPATMIENSRAELPAADGSSSSPQERSESVAMIAHAIRIEADSMELRLRREPSETVPVVVGGVSRIEELINDLLSYSRNLGAAASESQAPSAVAAEVTHGLSGLLASGSLSDA